MYSTYADSLFLFYLYYWNKYGETLPPQLLSQMHKTNAKHIPLLKFQCVPDHPYKKFRFEIL